MTDQAYVTLALVPGIGRARVDALLRAFGSAEAALGASLKSLTALPEISLAAATAIRGAEGSAAARVLARAGELGSPSWAAGRTRATAAKCVAISRVGWRGPGWWW
ncbi:MAG: hypothetical protein HYT81_03140 [Gemmatimonadetes bacterium]|nr:hypothetical protein [Gemmatimonadota bacterium]